MSDSQISARSIQATANNARWCDAVCRAHGAPGTFQEHLWLNRRPTPRFYPNLVTLTAVGVEAQLAAVRELQRATQLDAFAVKDSFARLDLAPLGFQVLFEATWLWRDAALPPPASVDPGLRWAIITEPADLTTWEIAWNGPPADPATLPPLRVFLPSLLTDPAIRFVAAYRDHQLVAGAIANRSGDIVGVSNIFAPAEATSVYWAGCLATISAAFPGLPLVGYERGEERTIAEGLGFTAVGPLRVWGDAAAPL
jgi:hypothetical protein